MSRAAVLAGPGAGATGTGEPEGARAGAPRRPRRSRRWWWPAAAVSGLVLVAVLSAVVNRPPTTLPLAPDNPRTLGARALAQILEREGVTIAFRRSVDGALEATPPDGTLFVTRPDLLTADQWRAIAATEADVVLTDVAFADLGPLTTAVETTGLGHDEVRGAACSDPDAVAAGTLATRSGDVRATGEGVVVCFPADPAQPDVGAYAVVQDGDRTIRIVADARPFTNQALAEAGNAALALRVLGATEHLTWLVPTPVDPGPGRGDSALPPGADAVAAWALLLVAAVALWQGRRLGRVVSEPLPVIVPAAETTRGRARLYRRARAHAHAAAALRAGTASRLAHRTGVPASADPTSLVAALARATGRSPADVGAVLYGPPPDDDEGLLALVRELDTLESEVRP